MVFGGRGQLLLLLVPQMSVFLFFNFRKKILLFLFKIGSIGGSESPGSLKYIIFRKFEIITGK